MKKILFVCTGNICRSPLAAALARRELDHLAPGEFAVSSAGTGAWDGNSASEGAYLVAIEHGLDVSDHKARLLDSALVAESDYIFTMGRHHLMRVEELGGVGKVHLLGEFAGEGRDTAEVADPFGADIEVYRETFVQLERIVEETAARLAAGVESDAG